MTTLPPIAVSLGDPAGIGPEIVAKAWQVRGAHNLSPFFAIGHVADIRAVWKGPVQAITSVDEAESCFDDALPCLEIESGSAEAVIPGQPGQASAVRALTALETGVGLTKACSASALVTGPVAKAQLYEIGFTYPGQTEFIAQCCGISPDNAVMMLASPELRVVPVTIHLALADVPGALSVDLICARARITARALTDLLGIARPRIAVAGLNPHAGEHGRLGREEMTVITPAIERLRAEGYDASGPFSADGLFHERARAEYDVALCMYHDQALIPLKTLNFDSGVNMTLGLPVIRTSPDHGTAFGLAGKNAAHPGAMIEAIKMARFAATHRRKQAE